MILTVVLFRHSRGAVSKAGKVTRAREWGMIGANVARGLLILLLVPFRSAEQVQTHSQDQTLSRVFGAFETYGALMVLLGTGPATLAGE